MVKGLQHYFPMIRTRAEVLNEIRRKPDLADTFDGWKKEEQETFLELCTGAKGIKILYDPFFKEIFNPEYAPERLDEFLSLLLEQPATVKEMLPVDSTRLADESSLVIMDMLVQLADGTLVNLEIQKIGYNFPGQRCACYSSDLLLRQYKRVRSRRKKKFSYKDIKKVYTIVLFEKSTDLFHAFPDCYIHRAKQKFDTGLELDLLQEYICIPLDIFREKLHNRGIKSDLDAWLAFLCEDDPVMIERLIASRPEFIPLYEEVYRMCENIDRIIELYSEELRVLDRNTVQLMIDEQQETIDKQKAILNQQEEQINQQEEQISYQKEQLDQKDREIEELKRLLAMRQE